MPAQHQELSKRGAAAARVLLCQFARRGQISKTLTGPRPRCPGPARCHNPGGRTRSRAALDPSRTNRGRGTRGTMPEGPGKALRAAPCPARRCKSRPGGLSPTRSARSGRSSTATARRHRVPSCPRTCWHRRGPGVPGVPGSGVAPGGCGPWLSHRSRLRFPWKRARGDVTRAPSPRAASGKVRRAGPCWGRARSGGGSVQERGAAYTGTFGRAVGPAEFASFPSLAPAAPPGTRAAAEGRARGCQESRWRRGGGDKAARGGAGPPCEG